MRSEPNLGLDRFAGGGSLAKFGLLPEGSQPDTVPESFLRELLKLRN